MRTNMNVTVNKTDLLEKLKANRAKHLTMVQEARAGYLAKAKKALDQKMALLLKGQIVSLGFSLRMPVDHTSDYDTSIGMLEMATNQQIDLDASQYRTLVEDKWDWEREFYLANSGYSRSCADEAETKGFGSDSE